MTIQDAIDVIKDAGYASMATIDQNGEPQVRPMMPYLTDDGILLTAVLSHSRCIEQVKNNPKTSFCFVDRKMNFVRVNGDTSITDDLEKKSTVFTNVAMLRQYFSGPDDPRFVLLETKPTHVEAMTPHQKEPDVFHSLAS